MLATNSIIRHTKNEKFCCFRNISGCSGALMGSGGVTGPGDSSKDPAEVGHNKKRIVGGVTVLSSPHAATYWLI